tara:strand:- start:502 stop:1539 length:1038 start_codon:yes stop_codon:yes gene_type:complete
MVREHNEDELMTTQHSMPSHRDAWSGHVPDVLSDLADGVYDFDLADRGHPYQAGVPQAIAAALRHSGVDVSFSDFTAMSGWSTGFAYQYGSIEPGFMAIRAGEGRGKWQVFRMVDWFGIGYDACPVADRDRLWDFVRSHIDAGVPLIAEHLDGGLIVGYRHQEDKREVWFQGDPGFGWTDIDALHPFEVVALVKQGEVLPPSELRSRAVDRMVHYAELPAEGEIENGIAALEAYALDVADPGKHFNDCREYFCWATFNRLDTRSCASAWLAKVAETADGLSHAGELYEQAADCYRQYRLVVGGGLDDPSIDPRAPATVAEALTHLERGLSAERAAWAKLTGYLDR